MTNSDDVKLPLAEELLGLLRHKRNDDVVATIVSDDLERAQHASNLREEFPDSAQAAYDFYMVRATYNHFKIDRDQPKDAELFLTSNVNKGWIDYIRKGTVPKF